MRNVSIAMATCNGALFIREQLATICRQTVQPAELIVTDDASTDDTLSIVREFAASAPFPVRIFENSERLGFRANFMRAIDLCSCEYIALCDQDDIWFPNKLARMLASFDAPDIWLSYHEAWLINSSGERLGLAHIYPLLASNPPSSVNAMRNPYGFAMVFHRRLLQFADLWAGSCDNLHSHLPMAHDQWLFFLASALGTVAYVDEPLAGYRQHGSNTYGFAAPQQSWRGRVTEWMTIRSKEYPSLAIAADRRAAILSQAAARLDAVGRARADVAIARYRTFSMQAGLRAAIYERPELSGRLAAWWALLRAHGYRSQSRWTFGLKAAIVDLACLLPSRWWLNRVLR